MKHRNEFKILVTFLAFMVLVIAGSSISMTLWGEKPGKIPLRPELRFEEGMTLSEFGKANELSNPLIKEVFGFTSREDLQKRVTEFNLSRDQIVNRVNRALALEGEHQSKDWFKILLKFALWVCSLGFVYFLMRKRRITSINRRWILLSGVVIFGVLLGSDPSPMGTIKDAIVLFAKSGVIFPPRAIALAFFLILVLIANKFICTWGCQFGTLQDFIFRMNRDKTDRKGVLRQVKPPFFLSNTIRVTFLGVFALVAFLFKVDIIEGIDPFKIFNPGKIVLAGGIFVGAIAVASLFIYRPWCHFFCPFGLAGWIVEKVSIVKVKVNYETCIACEACAKACPSTVMNAILKRERAIPDCFSCATCIETCPTRSITFQSGKRSRPPAGKFKRREN
jgi:NAD-dependent dihydropyrimidine dehydrogenase PreA subunit